jgi:hypothetical protein
LRALDATSGQIPFNGISHLIYCLGNFNTLLPFLHHLPA